jgi:alkylhydroperoxidase/carboxymuconolactone decarboxylase family protein YurZ
VDYPCTLRKLAVRDDRVIHSILGQADEGAGSPWIDLKSRALVTLGALIAIDAAPPSYMSAVGSALAAGATVDEIVGTLIAVLPVVGVARVVSAAPNLGLALGYDVDAALESFEDARPAVTRKR